MFSYLLNRILPDFTRSRKLVNFRWRWIATILALQLVSVVFEGIGLGSMIPVLEYMKNDGNVDALMESSEVWQFTSGIFDFVGLEIGLGTLLLLAFAAVIFRQAFMLARLIYSSVIQSRLVYQTRNKLFDSYLHSSLEEHDRLMSGDVINDMTVELENTVGAMRSAVEFAALVSMMLAYVVVVFLMSAGLSLAAGVIIAVVGLSLIYLTRRVEALGKAITTVNQNISAFLVERLNSVRLVRLSGIEQAEIDRFEQFTRHQRNTMIDLQRLKAIFSMSIEPLVLAFAFVLLFVAIEGKILAFEQIVVFFFILLRLAPVAREAMVQRQSYISLLGSIKAISKRMTSLSAAREKDEGRLELTELGKAVEFRNVSFRYPTREKGVPTLSNLSLSIRPGTMTAIVGPSGAGKSTLVDLLPGLRSPDSGEIRFNGIPQSEYSLASLRRAIAYVPQKAQILDVKIAEHIALGHPSASFDDIQLAARRAGAHEFIMTLPNAYETPLGEGGGRLSGGQRQRLDLARAIIREAPLLILDEPTASLDAESEAAFKSTLQRIRRETGMTIVIIGHRFSTVADADQIIVLQDGEVTEQGTHDQLMEKGHWYAKAYEKQMSKHGGTLKPAPRKSPEPTIERQST